MYSRYFLPNPFKLFFKKLFNRDDNTLFTYVEKCALMVYISILLVYG